MVRKPTRREFLATGTTLASGGLALHVLTDTASATIEDATFSIPDSEVVLTDTSLEDITLAVDAETTVNSNAPIHTLELELLVGESSASADRIAQAREVDMKQTDVTIPFRLEGSLFSAADFDADSMEPTNGSIRKRVTAVLSLTAYRNDEPVSSDMVTEQAEIAISNEELSVTFSVDATGGLTVTKD